MDRGYRQSYSDPSPTNQSKLALHMFTKCLSFTVWNAWLIFSADRAESCVRSERCRYSSWDPYIGDAEGENIRRTCAIPALLLHIHAFFSWSVPILKNSRECSSFAIFTAVVHFSDLILINQNFHLCSSGTGRIAWSLCFWKIVPNECAYDWLGHLPWRRWMMMLECLVHLSKM